MDTSDGSYVALKRVKTFREQVAVPLSFYRENACLQDARLRSDNLVKLRDVFHDECGIVMVLEYCEFDLSGLIHRKQGLSVHQVRSYARQLFEGVSLLHRNSYVHRDLKPANVFVTRGNVVKLGDFGLSRTIREGSERPLTCEVVTPVYRAPELLLGDRKYGKAVDVWSLGCVLYEMMTGRILFKPTRVMKLAQLESIFKVCGSPTVDSWPEMASLPDAAIVQHMRACPSMLEEILERTLAPEFLGGHKDLLLAMLDVNPNKRITVDEALAHPFFAGIPELPTLAIPEAHASDIVQCPKAVRLSKPCLLRPNRVLPPPICA